MFIVWNSQGDIDIPENKIEKMLLLPMYCLPRGPVCLSASQDLLLYTAPSPCPP